MAYDMEQAVDELSELEDQLISRAEKLVDNYNTIELAKLLVLVNKEIYRIDEEARRLRLTGQLNLDIYNSLVNGYRSIVDRIFREMKIDSDTMAPKVKTLYKALKFSNELAGTYLEEYLHETKDLVG